MTRTATNEAGRYAVNDRTGVAYLTVLDALLRVRRFASRPPPAALRRVLLGFGGHLGDTIIATSILPTIRERHPSLAIGVVAPSWAMSVLEGHHAIRWLHTVDHWKLNRSGGRISRLGRWLHTHRQAIASIRAIGYEAAVDLYPYYPNMSVLLAQAGVGERVGYDSGGGGPAITHRKPWQPRDEHLSAAHSRLISTVLGELPPPTHYDLAPVGRAAEQSAESLLDRAGAGRGFIVLHPGTGDPRKAWPVEAWLRVAKGLASDGRKVVVTGAGAQENDTARWLKLHESSITDLSGQTSVAELRCILRNAALVVAPDSAAAHLAAAEDVPVVTLMSGPGNRTMWRPLGRKVTVIEARAEFAPDADEIIRIARRLPRISRG